MSAPNHAPSEDGPVRPRLPSFRSFEAQLSRPSDHSLQLAPMRRVDHPLPPRPVGIQLHPDYHWQEYSSEKCTCSGDQYANRTPPYPSAAHRYPTSVHRLPSPPAPHHPSFLMGPSRPPPFSPSSSHQPPPSPRQHQPPSPHSQPLSPLVQRPSPPAPARRTSSSTRSSRARGGMSRPRWRPEERLQLFQAVSRDKELEQMSTFRWDEIAQQVGRSRKSCKDQWRREILRTINEVFEHQTLGNRNLGFVPREPDEESMEDDSEQENGNSVDYESD